MRLRVVHHTKYEYSDPVTTSHHQLYLTPRDDDAQVCMAHEIVVTPEPGFARDRLDYFGNRTRYFGVQEPHRSLSIVARSEVRRDRSACGLPVNSPAWEDAVAQIAAGGSRELLSAYELTFDSPYVGALPALSKYASPSFPRGRSLVEGLIDLTRRIYAEFVFDPKATQVSTPIADVLRQRRGVCQDFAHLQIGCLRSLGLPGRYMSGYLLTLPPPGKPKLIGADASHAWVATYCPGFGWISVDPTNNLVQPPEHVLVACGRDFGDVTPVRGVILGGGPHTLHVSVDVTRVDEAEAPC